MIQFYEKEKQLDNLNNIHSVLLKGNFERHIPEFTILIPTYNRPELLIDSLNSALNQNISNTSYEILIIDNLYDSESKTAKYILNLKDDRIIYYQNTQNLGGAGNWNRGLELCRSKWVLMLHDDDIIYPETISRAKNLMKKLSDSNLAMIIPRKDAFGKNKPHENKFSAKFIIKKIFEIIYRVFQKDIIRWRITFEYLKIQIGSCSPTCGALINRDIILSEGGYPNQYKSCDLMLLLTLSMNYGCYSTNMRWGGYRFEENDTFNVNTMISLVNEYYEREKILYNYYTQKNIFYKIDGLVRKHLYYYIYVKWFCDKLNEEDKVIFRNGLDKTLLNSLKINVGFELIYYFRRLLLQLLGCFHIVTHKQY